MPDSPDISRILRDSPAGDRAALERAFPIVYGELRRLAQRFLGYERPDHSLQATGLVHEAYLRLLDQNRVQWQSRKHLIRITARLMRRILIDHARRVGRQKRGGAAQKISIDEIMSIATDQAMGELRALDAALAKLAEHDPALANVVKLRFFGGLTHREIATALGLGERTVERYWRSARTWLETELRDDDAVMGPRNDVTDDDPTGRAAEPDPRGPAGT